MDSIVLSLGTNKGDREAYLEQAHELLKGKGISVLKASSVYESEPVGYADQGDFLNQLLIVETTLKSEELLKTCLGIESEMGRVRSIKNGPRVIDIDLLFYHDEVSDKEDLILPHPRISERLFVLIPLVELLAHEIHPIIGVSSQKLLENCKDQSKVEKYK